MKAIAIRQPFAHYIVTGDKKIKYRSWRTNHRGPILIHASLTVKMDQDGLNEYCNNNGFPVVDSKSLPRGGIVGYATIVDCVEYPPSHKFSGSNPSPK